MRTQLHSTAGPACLTREFSRRPARRASFQAALAIFAAVSIGLYPAQAAVTEAWVHRYSGLAQAAAVDGSGNVVVTGDFAKDYYTAKYAVADGALLGEKRLNGPANSEDEARALAVDGNGNV
jgi:hypothetical protein